MRSTNGTHHAQDEAIDVLYAWMPGTQPAPQPCPESLFSLTLKGTIGGQDALLTVRGMTSAQFKENLNAIRGLLDHPQTPAVQVAASQGQDFCPVHQVAMKQTTKEGRSWWSHYDQTAGKWCKGRG